jgi:hypothetical protein
MGLFEKLSRPKEVKATLAALGVELEIANGAGHGLALSAIHEDARRAVLGQAELIQHKIRDGGETPDVLALLLIANLCRQRLACGYEHIYRGALSMRGTVLLSLWEYVTDALNARGVWSQNAVAENGSILMDEIKEVG